MELEGMGSEVDINEHNKHHILEIICYAFVPMLPHIVLKGKITKRTIVSIVLILIEVVLVLSVKMYYL